jgi:hypothetical protein
MGHRPGSPQYDAIVKELAQASEPSVISVHEQLQKYSTFENIPKMWKAGAPLDANSEVNRLSHRLDLLVRELAGQQYSVAKKSKKALAGDIMAKLPAQMKMILRAHGLNDDELNEISNNLQLDLNEARHNLIETQKQIIDYINQIEHQGRVIEQIRHVKYLKDQFELKTKTNVNQFLGHNKDIFFETRTTFPVNPALDALQEDQIYEMILQMNRSKNIAVKPEIEEAGAISEDYLQSHDSEQFFIDHETVKNQFVATRNNLFDFIVKYEFSKQIEFPERVGLFCQILSQYEDELKITNQYKNYKGVEYAIVLPK